MHGGSCQAIYYYCLTEDRVHDGSCQTMDYYCLTEEWVHGGSCKTMDYYCLTEEGVHGGSCQAMDYYCLTEEGVHDGSCQTMKYYCLTEKPNGKCLQIHQFLSNETILSINTNFTGSIKKKILKRIFLFYCRQLEDWVLVDMTRTVVI